MRGSIRLIRIFGIDIDIHITFFLLLGLFAVVFGVKGLVLVLGVFLFVTMHELCHSLVALYFGVKVKSITLLPIGGVASMNEIPTKPYQEFLISIAGPLSNLLVVIIFFYPLYFILGKETLMYPFRVFTGQVKYVGGFNIAAHIYWINLILAVFNMLPAFPMDGGRVLRALLSYRMSFKDATAMAVRVGHIFALMFAYFGIVNGHIFLLIIAVFIYMAASSEGFQVQVTETIKFYTIEDVLSDHFVSVERDTQLYKILEIMFHSHQEDFSVMENRRIVGFLTRREVISGMHVHGKSITAGDIMRTDIPVLNSNTKLPEVRKLMQKHNTSAFPVEEENEIAGIVTIEDINRVYTVVHK